MVPMDQLRYSYRTRAEKPPGSIKTELRENPAKFFEGVGRYECEYTAHCKSVSTPGGAAEFAPGARNNQK